jgi:catechol 2,3-dioxygenase-like lactoylglutathione lyase family enzyme
MVEVNGMAHVILTVSSFGSAQAFYGQLLPFFGLKRVFGGEKFAYWIGGRTAVGIQKCDDRYRAERFVQYRVGLHHACFRAREREDIDVIAVFLRQLKARIVRGPESGEWAPGYYYILFEDPDGIRLELCHVPGTGLLTDGIAFAPGSDF